MGHFLHPFILVLLWTCLASALDTNDTSNLLLEFFPEQLTLIEEETVAITLNIWDNSTGKALEERPWMASPGHMTVLSDNTYNLNVINGSFEVSPCDFLEDKNYTIILQANSLGYANLQVFWEQLADTQTTFNLSSCYSGMYKPTAAQRETSDPASETTTGGQQIKDPTTTSGQQIKDQTTTIGQLMKDQITTGGQQMKDQTTTIGQLMKDQITTDGQQMKDQITTTGQQMKDQTTSATTKALLKNQLLPTDDEEQVDEPEKLVVSIESQEQITESPEEPSDDVPINETISEEEIEEIDDSETDTDQTSDETSEAQEEELDPQSTELKDDLNETNATDEQALETESLLYKPKPQAPPKPTEDIATSSPEVQPDMTPKTKMPRAKKAEKVQVYKEGITFLFKRSQELSVEEEAPVTTKILVSDSYRVKILRDAGALDTVFVVVVSMAVMVNTLMMGMQIDLAIVWGILKKPIGPAVGFFSQFAFMPVASYVLGLLLLTDPNLRLGLFTLGCSPGGNGSNFWTLMLKGDLNLSITMTLISTTSALFMMPMWLFTLGQTIVEDGHIGIPFTNLILSLFSFTIPVAIGVSIRRCKPTWANFAGRLIRPFTLVLIIVLLSLSIWNSLYIFRLITWQMIVAGLSIAWGGYIFGAFVAWVCRQKRPQIIAISIETAIQNPGITFMVLRLTLEQPDSDISAVAPVAQLLVTSTPLLLTYLAVMIYRRCKACQSRKMEEQLQEAARRDVDAADPLLINRTSTILPSNGTAKDKNELTASATSRPDNRRETPPPPYPGVNMYAQLDNKDLEKNEESTFAKKLANKQDSIDAVPLRNSEHIYENFRNGQQIEPLRESKV